MGFCHRLWWSLGSTLLLAEFAYNNSYHSNIQMEPFESLYGKRCIYSIGLFNSFRVVPWGTDLLRDSMDRVSPTKGVMRFGKKEKLSPWFIGPFEILKKCREVMYGLALPLSLSVVHPVFHVSVFKRYRHDDPHVIQWDLISLDQTLSFEEDPIAILYRHTRKLRSNHIDSVKV
ncbi:hypothetical protein MTR67_035426 [Solanum verrucosum]|uniref:Tf2-1-like SH3-like domain-containing protein n=1 Tax=Solanum verrucosum TaxID=315347 RepID=A0AAF0UAJ6_SOLVR|nr:hypothetical protein MTR67_035426 [Solanum verrucosum]